jgi:hypothetical protein
MKIYILGSNAFMHKMVSITDELIAKGFDAFIIEDYRELVAGERQEQVANWESGEKAKVKRENDYFRKHYAHILESDAVLFVNDEKKGIPNYIGGNVLIEMGQAYVNNKKIFFLNGMPKGFTYNDEIEAMDPICLNGNLANLKNYIDREVKFQK